MALVAAALGVAVVVIVLPGLAPPALTPAGEPLVVLDPATVHQIDVVPRDGSSYSFRRENGAWFLVRGEERLEVPSDRLDGFVKSAATLTRLVVMSEPEMNLAEFGLDPPRARVTLRGGNEVTLALGDRNPPLTALYVQVLPKANIVLVGAVLLWEFDKLVVLSKAQPVEP